jgi:hypothetical protein
MTVTDLTVPTTSLDIAARPRTVVPVSQPGSLSVLPNLLRSEWA